MREGVKLSIITKPARRGQEIVLFHSLPGDVVIVGPSGNNLI